MNPKIKMSQYVILRKLRKFDTTDIKYFTVLRMLFCMSQINFCVFRPNTTTSAQAAPPVKKVRTDTPPNVNRNLVTLGGANVNSSSSSASISITRPTGKTVKKTVISSKLNSAADKNG